MEYLESNKFKIFINIGIIILLIILVFLNIFGFIKKEEQPNNNTNEIVALKEGEPKEEKKKEEKEKSKYFVDIKGAVKKPGVYEVSDGMIVNDVINLAGGLKKNASTKYLNLSKKITDQMVINIYTINQVNKLKTTSSEPCVVETEDISNCEGVSIIETKPSSNNSSNNTSNKETNISNQTISKININNADISKLVTLSGIGEAKAKSIIEYRETNGGFKTIEDIMNVSGIGEAAYNKIKDYITV